MTAIFDMVLTFIQIVLLSLTDTCVASTQLGNVAAPQHNLWGGFLSSFDDAKELYVRRFKALDCW